MVAGELNKNEIHKLLIQSVFICLYVRTYGRIGVQQSMVVKSLVLLE